MSAESLDNTQRLLGRLDELESELSRVHHALEHHERLATLGTIAGLIAHEFNNILTPVLSYAQMALAAPDDRDLATKALHKAADGAERASQIAGSILGFVRDEGRDVWAKARAVPRPEQPEAPQPAADLRSAAQDAIACMGRDLERDLIELRISGDAGVRAAMKPLALQHILLNVILNARAAMLPLGGMLTIETGFADEPPRAGPEAVTTAPRSTGNLNSGWAVIRITDTGRGMRPETLGRIFEPFFTKPADGAAGRDDSTERRRGTGLGMTMCKRLADEVGGYLTVESRVGQGTCVTIVVPAAVPARELRRSA